jgi:F-type H+-transporting ATPase subunit epsilon
MIAATHLRLVLVTPETTLLDEPVTSLVFPLYDGQMGVLPGRAPMVGRLGAGELKIESAGGTRHYFIDGGFVQVKGGVVSVLTHSAVPADEIDVAQAHRDLEAASKEVATTDQARAARQHAQDRARRMISLRRRFS